MTTPRPGPELDAAVCKALGWKSAPPYGAYNDAKGMATGYHPDVRRGDVRYFSPSTDPAAAAELKRWLAKRGYDVDVTLFAFVGGAVVKLSRQYGAKSVIAVPSALPDPVQAECHALCLAALEAIGEKP